MNAVIAVGLMAGMMGSMAAERKPVVITTDIGTEIDDLWAVAHLALSPELEIKGVVTTHAPNLAPPAAESSSKFAQELMDKLPARFRAPVIAGTNKPLSGTIVPPTSPGVDFLLEAAKGRTPDNRLTVVVLGAATDVASAFLIDASWANRVSVVAMGFDNYPRGGDPWNVKNDPIAWRVLLGSGIPIVVGDTEVARRTLRMTPDRAHTLLAQLPEPGGLLLARFDAFMAHNPKLAQQETGSTIVWPIWDEVVTAYLIGAAKAETKPRPRLKDDLGFDVENPRGTIEWITSVEDGKVWGDLVTKIRAANVAGQ